MPQENLAVLELVALDRVLPISAVREVLGVGPTSIYKLVKLKLLAPPVKLTGLGRTGWRASDVKAYLDTLKTSYEIQG